MARVGRAPVHDATRSAAVTPRALGPRGRARRAHLWAAPAVDHHPARRWAGTRPPVPGHVGPVSLMTTRLDAAPLQPASVYWLLGALAAVLAPHALRIPVWVSTVVVAALAWRAWLAWR